MVSKADIERQRENLVACQPGAGTHQGHDDGCGGQGVRRRLQAVVKQTDHAGIKCLFMARDMRHEVQARRGVPIRSDAGASLCVTGVPESENSVQEPGPFGPSSGSARLTTSAGDLILAPRSNRKRST